MIEIEVTESTLIVHIKGRDKIWALKSHLEIPLAHVVGAGIDPTVVEQWRSTKVLKVAIVTWGTNVRGVLKAGSFYVDGHWTFWDVNDPQKAITITLADEHYTRLVLEVTDPTFTVARIEEVVRTHKPS